jgi:hypothetical protein
MGIRADQTRYDPSPSSLYRIYPKLGISARGELASVLEPAS